LLLRHLAGPQFLIAVLEVLFQFLNQLHPRGGIES
jgi:hypothetical protein